MPLLPVRFDTMPSTSADITIGLSTGSTVCKSFGMLKGMSSFENKEWAGSRCLPSLARSFCLLRRYDSATQRLKTPHRSAS